MTAAALVIRDATPADFDAITALTVDVYVGGGFVPRSDPYAARLADTAARAADAQVVVAEHDGAIVGSLTVARAGTTYAELARPDELEFRMLGVADTARGLGVGTALVKYVIDIASTEGAVAVAISTSSTMVDARRIYDRLGFVHVPERDWQPIPGLTLTALVRPISPARSR